MAEERSTPHSFSTNGAHPVDSSAANDPVLQRFRKHTLWLRVLSLATLAFTIWLDATNEWEAPSWLLAGLLAFAVGYTPKQFRSFMS